MADADGAGDATLLHALTATLALHNSLLRVCLCVRADNPWTGCAGDVRALWLRRQRMRATRPLLPFGICSCASLLRARALHLRSFWLPQPLLLLPLRAWRSVGGVGGSWLIDQNPSEPNGSDRQTKQETDDEQSSTDFSNHTHAKERVDQMMHRTWLYQMKG